MLHLIFSNRFECLLDALIGAMAKPPRSPFAREEIIVSSAAIRRRVELEAADRFGICSNVGFSYLAQWAWRQIGHVVAVSETSPFTSSVMTWRVLGIFAEAAFVAEHPALARYLGQADDVMRYELAARTAALLEQYLTYRSDWLEAWLSGNAARIPNLDAARRDDERWQGALWRRIARDLGTDRRHPSVVFFETMKKMGPDAPAEAGLPATAHVFCLPTTPPLYLEILRRLAQWIELRMYVLNPCQEYWFEAVAPRRLAYLVAHDRADHHEVGNRLLASWGRQTQDQIVMLLEDGAAQLEDARFEESTGDTLLARLQNAILEMTDLERGSVTIAPGDRSLEVHVCHSLTRELEVLQDQLLALFAGADPPRPSDILVVTPDLESAAPLIDAVFGTAPPMRQIPYAITGRPASALDSSAQALLAILAVATSRFQASRVFDLLQKPIVARRFGIGTGELETIHAWIRDSGIRWGIDGEHRRELGLPAVERNSFGDGLDRLFLGYAMPASATMVLNGRLGAGNPEGSAALALGQFAAFVGQLERLHVSLAQPKPPTEWRQALLSILENFTAPVGDEIDDARETAACIDELHANMTEGGMSATSAMGEPIAAGVVRAALAGLLDDPTRGGVPGGAVTFAAMTSLRHLPYRILCVLGLNDGAFPSTARPIEFDLMAHDPRRGDRQRRADERNVFLDLMLAARERLYLSYTGKSVRDNSPIPPSVLVAELIDYAACAIEEPPFSAESIEAARRRLTVQHPLQPFALAYFEPDTEPRLRSFNGEYCEALKRRLDARQDAHPAPVPPRPAGEMGAHDTANDADDPDDLDATGEEHERFFQARLDKPGPEFHDVTLESLTRFFANPCRYLLRQRLAIRLPEGDEDLEDEEPFVSDVRARGALAERLLPRLLEGESVAELHGFARAGIEYPSGRLGDLELDQELQMLGDFAARLGPVRSAVALEPVTGTVEFTIDGEPWRLSGGFGDLSPSGLVRYRYDNTRAKDYLNGWIAHLFLNVLGPAGMTPHTVWHSRDGHFRLPPVEDAREQLGQLVSLYRDGLREPLHFYPKSAWEYASNGKSLSKAQSAWQTTRFRAFGEDRDRAYRLALRGVEEPLDDAFERCAMTVFGPLLRVVQDDRLGGQA